MRGLVSFDRFEVLDDFAERDAISDKVIKGRQYIFRQSLLLKLREEHWHCQECLVMEAGSKTFRQAANCADRVL